MRLAGKFKLYEQMKQNNNKSQNLVSPEEGRGGREGVGGERGEEGNANIIRISTPLEEMF